MTGYLTVAEIIEIHDQIIREIGGSHGIRDWNGIDSAAAQPQHSFGGTDLYPTIAEKGATLAFSLIQNHAFVDGNKRVGYEAMRLFLRRNGYEVAGSVDEKERVVLAVAAGEMGREAFTGWVREHLAAR